MALAISKIPLMQDMWISLLTRQKAIREYAKCPITQEELGADNAVLASDGYLYDGDALQTWLDAGHIHSPVTREALRGLVLKHDPEVSKFLGDAERDLRDAEPTWLPLHMPRSPCVSFRQGTVRAARWNTKLGVVCRIFLNWTDDDTIEWRFPVFDDTPDTLLTPPPAIELVPMARPLLRWLRLHVDNPEHIVTCEFRVVGTDSFATFEDLLLQGRI